MMRWAMWVVTGAMMGRCAGAMIRLMMAGAKAGDGVGGAVARAQGDRRSMMIDDDKAWVCDR